MRHATECFAPGAHAHHRLPLHHAGNGFDEQLLDPVLQHLSKAHGAHRPAVLLARMRSRATSSRSVIQPANSSSGVSVTRNGTYSHGSVRSTFVRRAASFSVVITAAAPAARAACSTRATSQSSNQ